MSDLLNKASLVVIPSGYKEDTVYSVVPSDGAGDLSFTRASNGTRINSAGLVEVCPWNLVEYSEQFDNAYWQNYALTITANTIAAPNGTTTADTFTSTGNFGGVMYKINQQSAGTFTTSVYVKAGNFNLIRLGITDNGTSVDRYSFLNLSTLAITNFGSAIGSIESVGNDWYRFIVQFTSTGNFNLFYGLQPEGTSGKYAYFWGAQLNIGSTAKPYFPTTDRLNVPRLTYQNGGGGCPSLLLEKQSTNLITYSEDLSSSDWTKQSGISVTANQTISPDGTQNADLVTGNGSTGIFQSGKTVSTTTANTKSVWLKGVSGGEVVILKDPNATLNSLSCTLTTSWQRFTLSEVQSGGLAGLWVSNIPSGGIYIWGAQLEDSTYPTSYIPTTSSSATRVADACYKTGISSLIGQTEGVIFLDAKITALPTDGSLFGVQKTASNFVIRFGSQGSNIYAQCYNGSTNLFFESTSVTLGTRVKMAFAYKAGDYAFYVNGTQIATGTNATTIPACDEVMTNSLWGNTNPSLYEINEAVISKTRLTNAELAQLTA